jgi:hypothetical protein
VQHHTKELTSCALRWNLTWDIYFSSVLHRAGSKAPLLPLLSLLTSVVCRLLAHLSSSNRRGIMLLFYYTILSMSWACLVWSALCFWLLINLFRCSDEVPFVSSFNRLILGLKARVLSRLMLFAKAFFLESFVYIFSFARFRSNNPPPWCRRCSLRSLTSLVTVAPEGFSWHPWATCHLTSVMASVLLWPMHTLYTKAFRLATMFHQAVLSTGTWS